MINSVDTIIKLLKLANKESNRTAGITNQTIVFFNLESIPKLVLRRNSTIYRIVGQPAGGRLAGRLATFFTMMIHIRVGRTIATMATMATV